MATSTTQPTKAVLAFILTFLTALYATIQGREETLDGMGTLEWFVVVLGAVVTAGTVWVATNKPTTGA